MFFIVRAIKWEMQLSTTQRKKQVDLLVVKIPSAGSPRVLPDTGDTTTV